MQPPQQPQQPMGAPQPYYGYPQAGAATAMPVISKKMVFLIIAVGALLLWIAQLALFTANIQDFGTLRAMLALRYTGAAIGLGGCLLGALGSPRTSDWQNVGLLILGGFFLSALSAQFFNIP